MKQQRVLEIILNFLLPPSETEKRIGKITEAELVGKLSPSRIQGVPFAENLFKYRDRDIKDLIWALKYYRKNDVAKLFGDFMYEHILGSIGENMYLTDWSSPILIPIPISSKRKRERGFNQAESIAIEILKCDSENAFSILCDVLQRKSGESHQAHTHSKQERRKNMKDSFYINNIEKIKNKNIILIDDVITTGATVSEARKVLLRAGAKKIKAICIAH